MVSGFRIAGAYVDVNLKDGTKADEAKIKARLANTDPVKIPVDVDTKRARKNLDHLKDTGRSTFSPLIASAIAAGTIIGGPLALGAVPVIFGGIAAVIVARNQEIKDSFKDLGKGIVEDLEDDTSVLVPYFQNISDDIGESFQDLRPQLRDIFTDLGPQLVTLTDGVLRFTSNAMPGFVNSVRNGQVVTQGLSDLLAKTGTGLGGFFTELSIHSEASGEVLSQVGDIMESLLPTLGQLLAIGSELGTGVLPVVNVALVGVSGVLTALGPPAGQTTGYLLAAVGAFKLFGAVGRGLDGLNLGGKMAAVALNAGVMTERLTGSAAAGQRVATSGDRVSGVLSKLGSALPVVGTVLVGFGLAWDHARQKADSAADAIARGGDVAVAAVRELQAVDADAESHGFGNWIGALREKIGLATPGLQSMRGSLDEVGRAQLAAAEAAVRHADTIKRFPPDSAQAKAAAAELDAAIGRVEQAQRSAAQATKSHTDRIIEQTNILAGAANADVAYQQSLLSVKDAQDAANQAAGRHSEGSRELQGAVLNLQQQVLSAADAAKRKAEADAASLGPQAQARAGSDAYASALINLASQANGPARAALLGYVARLDHSQLAAHNAAAATAGFKTQVLTLPDGRVVHIAVDPQTGKVIDLRNQINSVQSKTVTITINEIHRIYESQHGIAPLRILPRAAGGVFHPMATGGVLSATGYAGGGVRPMSATRAELVRPGDLRLIGDNMKATELFAPLDGSRRSLSFIRYGANAFGFDLMPMKTSNGRPGDPMPGAAGMSGMSELMETLNRLATRLRGVTINVNQAAGSPAELGRFVSLALRTVG